MPKSNREKHKWLEEQLSKRVALLEKYAATGLPHNLKLHKLIHVRQMVDTSEDIESIGSPSSFVTTHSIYGGKIKRISELLVQVNAKRHRKTPAAIESRAMALTEKLKDAECALQNATDQIVSLKTACESAQTELKVARQSIQDRDIRISEFLKRLSGNVMPAERNSIVTSIRLSNKSP